MNVELIILRLLHIVFGVFWAGSAIFFAVILQPRLRTLGPEIQARVMAALIPVMGPALISSAVITIVAGVTLALRLRWGNLDTFLNTGWGWAILIGFVASIGALSSGVVTIVLANRMLTLGRSIGERAPTPEEGARLQRIGARLPRLARSTAVLVLIAIGTMASARFV